MKAQFQCLRCNYRWETKPGPTQCPICGYLYVKWINYEELREVWNKGRSNKELI